MKTILYLNAIGEISGAERSLLAMLDAGDPARWRAAVAAPEGALLDAVRARGVAATAVALRALRRPASLPEAWSAWSALSAGWRETACATAAINPDMLHANTTPAMLYALRLREVPIVWHVRDLAPLGGWARRLYRRAVRVAVISRAVRDAVLPLADDGGAKIALLPPAVDTMHFHPVDDKTALRAALELPVDRPLIGMLAQFVPWKRHHLLLDALAAIADRPWHAVLAGADLHGDRDYLDGLRARLSASPLAGRVTLLPWQPDPAPLLAALDLLALTSDHEPFGRVLIEAMACAVPPVAIDDAGPREIITPGVTGLLAAGTVTAIGEAIVALLDDPARRAAMGHAARAQVEARYSLQAQREALAGVYGDC